MTGQLHHAHAIDDAIGRRTPEWIALFKQLLTERSTFEHEHGVLAVLEQWLDERGIPFDRVPHDADLLTTLPAASPPISRVAGRHSLVTRVRGTGGGRSLAFNTHLDIVPEGDRSAWSRDPFGGEIDGDAGVIYGRGAMDDRAGVVIAAALLQLLHDRVMSVTGDVGFQFVLEDETTGNGTLLCLAAGHRADAAVIIDGTRLDRAITAHAGQLQFAIVARGRPSSVSVSHVGCNAAESLAAALLRIKRAVFARNAARAEAWQIFPSPFQFVTLGLHADVTELTVPVDASATCYVTFPPPETLVGMRAFLERELTSGGEPNDATLSIAWNGVSIDPVESQAGELTRLLTSAAIDAGHEKPAITPSTGTSDLRHFAAVGIPALLYGPGRGFNPHRPDEHYFLEDLATMIRIFVNLTYAWCDARSDS